MSQWIDKPTLEWVDTEFQFTSYSIFYASSILSEEYIVFSGIAGGVAYAIDEILVIEESVKLIEGVFSRYGNKICTVFPENFKTINNMSPYDIIRVGQAFGGIK